MNPMIKEGALEISKFAESYQGWRAHARKDNTYNFIKEMDAYINSELNKIGYYMYIKIRHKNNKRTERVIIGVKNVK